MQRRRRSANSVDANERSVPGLCQVPNNWWASSSAIQDAPTWSLGNGFVVEYEPAVSNLVAAYSFDGNAIDTTGSGHELTVSGASLVSDRFGIPNGAYSFLDGTTTISGPLALPPSATISAWARWDGEAAPGGHMLFNTGAVSQGPDLYFYGGTVNWNIGDGTGNPFCDVPANVSDGDFHNYVVVVDGLSLTTKLYVDGNLIGTALSRRPGSMLTLGGAGGFDGQTGPYGKGDIAVTLTCADTEGATCSCIRQVTVRDQNPPSIARPADMLVQVAAASSVTSSAASAASAASAVDNCGEPSVTCGQPVSAMGLGNNLVTCLATDASGNSRSCSFNVYLNAAPQGMCTPVTVAADETCRGNASIDSGSSDPDSDLVACEQTPALESPFQPGTHCATLTCWDSHNASASCTAQVTVLDKTPPVISCPANQVVECSGLQGALAFTTAANDNCTGGSTACAFPSGSAFPLGNTVNQCTATDGSGNQATCSFTVQVRDSIPPVVVTRE